MKEFSAIFDFIRDKNSRIPLSLFLILCFNTILAPAVQAATPGELPRTASYAIGLLALVTFSLCIYLFVVIFQPEKF
ncbi:K(+)-transporting ATPase subunit F [Tolypothrix sp. PCC 7910]|uniref:K(+)-transporting ATPase subunit F n=1 Tax=Tolypothrix sp. PCC 7910 TaxID=2099387 RepID=UPI0014278868|nr:K(+)-transporting ATPase subunit F [Tolypothrix sp. PCC 7910]QIR41128.1 K(+)-transporting ATPase subunit F [Tolypothrix sp. PCC 7910]